MVADGARFTTRFAGLLAILARLESWIKAATVVKEFRGPPGTPVLLTTTQAAPIPSPHVAVFACTAAGLQTPAQTLQCAFNGLHQLFRPSPPVCSIRAYSICAPEALMMGAHFASSALMNSAVLAGVMPGVGSIPASCSRWRTAGSASALVMAALSASIIG